MPFKSNKQRRYLWANEPRIAKRWERDYANGGIARVGLANGTLASTLFPEGNLQNIIATSPTQKDYNIRATEDLVKNLPGGIVRDLLAPAGAGLMSLPYDAIQAATRTTEDDVNRAIDTAGMYGPKDMMAEAYGLAYDRENPLSSAYERMVGASAPLADRLSNLNFGSSAQAATPDDITRAMQTQGPDHMRRQTNFPTNKQTAPRSLGFDTSYGVANEADVAQEPLTQKKGNIFQRGWQGAKDFKTSIGEGITGILDNTMLGKFAAMNDATNRRAFNYNPALQGQIDYLKGRGDYGVMDASGLNKITGGVLAGKNLQSLFGSNDLGKMYDKSIALTQKTIDNFGKQWSTLKKDDPDEYYKKLAFHQDKLKQKIEEKKLAGIAQAAMQKKIQQAQTTSGGKKSEGITEDIHGNPWDAQSHAQEMANTYAGGNVEQYNKDIADIRAEGGRVGYLDGGLAQYAPRGSYFNGGLASLWRR
jgi:hypothetical protein